MPEDLTILFHDEVQLMDWGESRSGGPWIKFKLKESVDLDNFRGLDTPTQTKSGHILNLCVSQGDIIPAQETPKDKALYGDEARALHQSGFMFCPHLWEHVGPPKSYQTWVTHQKSCLTGNFNEKDEAGALRNVPCHVRRVAKGAGTAFKPAYWIVPMTSEEHIAQHQGGETACLDTYCPGGQIDHINMGKWSETAAKDRFDEMAANSVSKWAWETLKKKLGYEHWNEVPPDVLRTWCKPLDLIKYLPKEYKQGIK